MKNQIQDKENKIILKFSIKGDDDRLENYGELTPLCREIEVTVKNEVTRLSSCEEMINFLQPHSELLREVVKNEGPEAVIQFLLGISAIIRPITISPFRSFLDEQIDVPRTCLAPVLESLGLRWFSVDIGAFLQKHVWNFELGEIQTESVSRENLYDHLQITRVRKFQLIEQLKIAFDQKESNRARGGTNAISGFYFQSLLVLHRTVQDWLDISEENRQDPTVFTEKLSDILETNTRIRISQSKLTMSSGAVKKSLDELWAIWKTAWDHTPNIIPFLDFQIVAQFSHLKNVSESISNWQPDDAIEKATQLRIFRQRVASTIETDPKTELSNLLSTRLFDHLPDRTINEWVGILFSHTPNDAAQIIWSNLQTLETRSSALMNPTQYYEKLLMPSNWLTHLWQLRGRTEELAHLHDFFKSQAKDVAILSGRGGIGKSRLIKAFVDDLIKEQTTPFFWAEGMPIIERDRVLLNSGQPRLLIVDDAHLNLDFSIINELASYVRQGQQLKLLLVTRPFALQRIQAVIENSGVDVNRIKIFEPLGELSQENVEYLAEEVLGNGHSTLAPHLAQLTHDNLFITVVAGRLLRDEGVLPSLLERHDTFRNKFLSVYLEKYLTDQNILTANQARQLYRLIAAISPFRFESAWLESTAKFLSVDLDDVEEAIEYALNIGALIRRGRTLKINPDVLSDYILHTACIGQEGTFRTFPKKVAIAFDQIKGARRNLLQNLAKLDWRLHRGEDRKQSIFEPFWKKIEADIHQATSNLQRIEIIENLDIVAVYQPNRTLGIVEYVIKNPLPPDPKILFRPIEHTQVLEKIPNLLQEIAYYYEHVRRCCEILINLATIDHRLPHQHPQHALRVLEELAEYKINKPYIYNLATLEFVENLIKENTDEQMILIGLSITNKLLARDIDSGYARAGTIILQGSAVDLDAVAHIRERTLSLLFKCLNINLPSVLGRVFQILERALQSTSIPYRHSAELPPEIIIRDKVHTLLICERIQNELKQQSNNALFNTGLIHCLYNKIYYSKDSDITQAAIKIWEAIPRTTDTILYTAIDGSVGCLYWLDNMPIYEKNRIINTNELMQNKANILTQTYPNSEDGFAHIKILIETLIQFYRGYKFGNIIALDFQPLGLLLGLIYSNSKYLLNIVSQSLLTKSTSVFPLIGPLLAALRSSFSKEATRLASEAIRISEALGEHIAATYWTPPYNTLSEEDFALLQILLSHPASSIKVNALKSLDAFLANNPSKIKNILLQFDVGSGTKIASAILSRTFTKTVLSPSNLGSEEVGVLLQKFLNISKIDDYDIKSFISKCAEKYPDIAANFLMNRADIAYKRSFELSARFDPVPEARYNPITGFSKNDQSTIIMILKGIIQWVRSKLDKPDIVYAAQVFEVVDIGSKIRKPKKDIDQDEATKILSPGRIVLLELSPSVNENALLLAYILQTESNTAFSSIDSSKGNFIFNYPEFINQILHTAAANGKEFFNVIKNLLYCGARPSGHTSTLGNAPPILVATLERARQAAGKLDRGTHGYLFYRDIESWVQTEIDQKIEDDEENM